MQQPNLKNLDHFAWLLDSSIKIPGTNWRIGLDGLIGLIPGIGDLTAGAISSYIVLQAVRMGVSPLVIARMVLNIALESVLGVIPIAGDIFDFIFKANQRNVQLMHEYLDNPVTVKRRSTLTVISVALLIIAALALIVWAVFSLLTVLLAAISH